RKHSSGQARVTLYCVTTGRRRDVLLGPHGSQESVLEYTRVIAQWEAAGRRLVEARDADGPKFDLTINELNIRFMEHAEKFYRRADGTDTRMAENFGLALRPMRELYGLERAVDFGPLKLKAVRQRFIDAGHARSQINAKVNRIRQVFKWAVEEEL